MSGAPRRTAAVIGLGPQGRRDADAVIQHPGLALVAVADSRAEALQADGLPAAVHRHAAAHACWADGGIEVACIATNAPSHAELVEDAIRCGVRRLLVEKPMACSVAECDRILSAALRGGARLSVHHGARYDPFYRWLRGQVRSGALGEVRSLYVQRPGIGLGCLGTHSFDMVRFLTGRGVRAVTAWVDPPLGTNPRGARYVDPGGLVILDLDGGARAVVAQIEDGAGPSSLEIDLTGGRVRVDDRHAVVEILRREPGSRPARYEAVEPPAGLRARPDGPTMLAGLLDDLLGDGVPAASGADGRASVEILVASHVSHEAGHAPVPLPLAAEHHDRWLPVT